VPEPYAEANSKDHQASLAEAPWHDKVLTDAIGYTKGLVTLLDSLTEGFQRRGRELEEHRNRLAILQSERRAILENRAGLESQLSSLTAERDEFRSAVEERDRELERLRQEIEPSRVALEAHAREIQALQLAMADRARQAEDLREVVRALERQLERAQSTGHAPELSASRQTAIEDSAKAPQRGPDAPPLPIPDSLRAAEEQVGRLIAERDGLRSTVEELREAVRGLELERDSAARRQSTLEGELEEERRRVREAATRARQEHAALRADLDDAEALLETARRDMARDQGLITNLRRTIEEERAQQDLLQRQAQSHARDVSRLTAAIQGVQALLEELSSALGEGVSSLLPQGGSSRDQEELAILQPLLAALRDFVGSTDGTVPPSVDLATDRAAVKKRAEQIAHQWRQLLRGQAESARREQHLSDENARLSAQLAAVLSEREGQQGGQRPASARDRKSQKGGGTPERVPADKTPSAPLPDTAEAPQAARPSAASRPPAQARQASLSGAMVECMLEPSSGEPTRTLRGVICRINAMGLMAALEERCQEGRRVAVRFEGGGEAFSLQGKILRVQQPASAPDTPPVFHHLIRFESSPPGSLERLQTLVG
jgi:DNA repair exonuclease SbcCD ATPase subunit